MNNCLINTLNEKVDGPLRPLDGYVITLTSEQNYNIPAWFTKKTSRDIYGDAVFYTDASFSTIDGDGKHKEIPAGSSSSLYVKVNKAPCQIVIRDNYSSTGMECTDSRLLKFRNIKYIGRPQGVEPFYMDSSDLRELNAISEVYLFTTNSDEIVHFDIMDFAKCTKLGPFHPCGGAIGEVEELLQAMYDNGRRSGTFTIGGDKIIRGETNITYQGARLLKTMKFQFSDTGWSIVEDI